MSSSERHIKILLNDGFQPGIIAGDDVDTVLKAIEGHTKPSTIRFEQNGKPLAGDYMEMISNIRVQLDASRAQFLHTGQILVVVGAYNKANLH